MRFDCIILDFDGTFTDVEEEAVPFLSAYREGLASMLGDDVATGWDEAAAIVRGAPDDHGWEFEGRIVAPSHADPYIMAVSTAQRLLDAHGLLPEPEPRRRALEELFKAAYPRNRSHFRPFAREVVDAIVETGVPVRVVTNSHPDAVEAKIDALEPATREALPVHGNAKKYVVDTPVPADDRFRALPETQTLDGLARPVHLHRGRYYEILRGIWEETEATPERTLICGDIYELDLAMPAALGAHVHLVCRPGTPRYEREAVSGLAHGGVSEELAPVLERL